MKVKTVIPLVLAVVLGLAALLLTRNAMSRGKGEVKDTNVIATVIAARDIEPGQKFSPADLMLSKTSADSMPTGSFRTPNDLFERVTSTRLVKGQPVLESLLAPVGSAAGVQALIPDGMRAITLQVNEFSGVAGLLVPGCKVDIISVIRNDAKEGSVARTIVQNVEVRAIGRMVSAAVPPVAGAGEPPAGTPPAPIPNNVTLLVSPEQAEAIQLASVGGAPWLVLRNAKDTEPFESIGTSLADLRGKSKSGEDDTQLTSTAVEKGTAPVAKANPKTRAVKFIRATKEENLQVEVAPPAPTGFLTKTDDGEATSK